MGEKDHSGVWRQPPARHHGQVVAFADVEFRAVVPTKEKRFLLLFDAVLNEESVSQMSASSPTLAWANLDSLR